MTLRERILGFGPPPEMHIPEPYPIPRTEPRKDLDEYQLQWLRDRVPGFAAMEAQARRAKE